VQRANPNVEAHAAWALVAQRKLRRTMVNARWAPAGKGRGGAALEQRIPLL
jgi:hypothetical protein